MTLEDKELLLVDLSVRLPFKVKVKVECTTANGEKIEDEGVLNSIYINEYDTIYVCVDGVEYELEHLQPYLRPMKSMTDEESEEYCQLQDKFLLSSQYPVTDAYEMFDWLNEHHFDYRGLIEKDLAIEVTEESNLYND